MRLDEITQKVVFRKKRSKEEAIGPTRVSRVERTKKELRENGHEAGGKSAECGFRKPSQ